MGANPWSDLCVASAGLEPYGWVALEVEDLTICFPFSLFLSFYSILKNKNKTMFIFASSFTPFVPPIIVSLV